MVDNFPILMYIPCKNSPTFCTIGMLIFEFNSNLFVVDRSYLEFLIG